MKKQPIEKPAEAAQTEPTTTVTPNPVAEVTQRLGQLKAAAYDTRKEIDRLSNLYNRIEAEIQTLSSRA